MGKLVGPLLDRVDLQLQVHAVSRAALAHPSGEGTDVVAGRVLRAREVQADRLAGTRWQLNADVPGPMMRRGPFRLPREATADLDRAIERGALTLRGYDRVLKLAWTVRDLDGGGTPTRSDVGFALTLRARSAVAA
jgi:magnesium chelatase family protein